MLLLYRISFRVEWKMANDGSQEKRTRSETKRNETESAPEWIDDGSSPYRMTCMRARTRDCAFVSARRSCERERNVIRPIVPSFVYLLLLKGETNRTSRRTAAVLCTLRCACGRLKDSSTPCVLRVVVRFELYFLPLSLERSLSMFKKCKCPQPRFDTYFPCYWQNANPSCAPV